MIKKILLFGFVMILLSLSVLAIDEVVNINLIQDSAADANINGQRALMLTNYTDGTVFNISTIGKNPLDTSTNCFIFNETGGTVNMATTAPIVNKTFVGNICEPNITVNMNQTYVFAAGNANFGAHNLRYRQIGGNLGYPKNGTTLNWTIGRQSPLFASTSWAFAIDNVTIDIIPPPDDFIDISLRDSYNSTLITNFTATITNSSNTFNITTTNGTVVWSRYQIVNITLWNISQIIYFNATRSNYNTSLGDLEMSTYGTSLSLTAIDGNARTISTFDCNNSFVVGNTTSGTIPFNVSGANITLECSSGNYTTVFQNITLNPVSSQSVDVVFLNSSIVITFRNESNDRLYNSSMVDIEFISNDKAFSNNYSTSTGTLTIPSIPNSLYNLIYSSNTTNKRSVFFYMPPETTQFNLTLYLLEDTLSETRGFIVQDENGNRVADATINISKFVIGTGWVTVGNYITNVNGLVAVDSEDQTLYRYEVYYAGELREADEEFFVVAVSGDTKTFTIVISDNTIVELRKLSGIYVNITNITTTRFRMLWEDPEENIDGACMYVYETDLSSDNLISTNCTATTLGSMFYTVPATANYYIARAYVNLSGTLNYVQSGYIDLKDKLENDLARTNFLYIGVIIMFALFFIFMSVDFRIALFMAIPVPILMFVNIGLMTISISVVYYLIIVVLMISMIASRTRGTS